MDALSFFERCNRAASVSSFAVMNILVSGIRCQADYEVLVKGMLWSRRNVSELLSFALLPVDNKHLPPQNEEQLLFDFG